MSRSFVTLAGWMLAAVTVLPLLGCQDAAAPAATPAAAPQETAPQADTTKEVAPKEEPSKKSAPPKAASKEKENAPAASKESSAAAKPAANRPRVDITFDTIKLDMKKEDPFKMSLITPKIHDLDGRRVKIRGYILPSFQQSGLTQFVLVRDNMECCFGPGAALYDCIVVEMTPGHSTDFTIRPVAVDGKFAVREFLDPDGKPLAIYHLDGEAVQ